MQGQRHPFAAYRLPPAALVKGLTPDARRGILSRAPLGRSLAVERLTLDQVGGVRIPAPQPFFSPKTMIYELWITIPGTSSIPIALRPMHSRRSPHRWGNSVV